VLDPGCCALGADDLCDGHRHHHGRHADGTYRFDRLPPGSYYVRFVDPSHAYRTEWFVNATRFTVATPVTVGTAAVVADAALAAA